MNSKLRLVLASGSPRRRELLARAGVDFEFATSDVAEVRLPGEPAREFALRMAREKALAVSARIPDALVIGADTIVECDGEILLKPADADDARRMLRVLSGRPHTVITAFALARAGAIAAADAVQSRVTFRTLSKREIDDYVLSGEPLDKAGAYGIQGAGGGFIARVDGPRDNVMGLPVEQVLAALRRCGVEC
ncbi:MAG TPA: Maf family protein [Candidatus Binataceae bacterium]|nr:Maf family protein [Candidatus Binataceae bacterium]